MSGDISKLPLCLQKNKTKGGGITGNYCVDTKYLTSIPIFSQSFCLSTSSIYILFP